MECLCAFRGEQQRGPWKPVGSDEGKKAVAVHAESIEPHSNGPVGVRVTHPIPGKRGQYIPVVCAKRIAKGKRGKAVFGR